MKISVIVPLFLVCSSLAIAQGFAASLDSFKQQLLEFKQAKTEPNQCLVFSNIQEKREIPLLKRPKKGSKPVVVIPQGQPCTILKRMENRKGEIWFEVELPQRDMKGKQQIRGWLTYDQVVTNSNIFPIGKGNYIILVFRPECESNPCPTAHWILKETSKKPLDMGQGHFVADDSGENIFFDQIKKVPHPTQKDREIPKAFIYRYQVSQDLLSRVGNGISPALHPKRMVVIFRDFKGQVLSADYAGALIQPLFAPSDTERVFKDPEKGLKPPPIKMYASGPEGILPHKIKIFRDPSAGAIPPPVEFVDDHTIRFFVLYDNGRIKATKQIRVN